jgi:hypothetical protein
MNEFEKLVYEMRSTQTEYFKTRDNSVFLKSKELERKVDSFLAHKVINNKQHYSNGRSKHNYQRSKV